MTDIQHRIESNGAKVDSMVTDVTSKYIKPLDDYISFIRECLCDGTQPPTNEELEDFILNLGTYIYFASTAVESVGIRDDISKAVYKEKYNERRNKAQGTVADKNAQAELESQEEELINNVYHRSYAVMKAKVNAAQELLSSCKKALSHRLADMELTRLTN